MKEQNTKPMNFIKETFIKRFNAYAQIASEIISNNPEYREKEQLYHYTSLEAIEAMIKSQTIRASSIFTMNDPNELIYGQKYMINKFSTKLSSQLNDSIIRQSNGGFSAFIFSLSELD